MTRALAGILLLALCAPRAATAGRPFGSCETPTIFRGGALNVIVLPYEYDPGGFRNPDAARVAAELPLLIQSATLAAIVKYSGVGATGLVNRSSDDECRSDEVLGKLDPMLENGQALVLVWGALYEDLGGLRIQTYVRFFRKGTLEALRFDVDSTTFVAPLTAQTVVFAKRTLSREDLTGVHEAFERGRYMRASPDDEAPGVDMYPQAGRDGSFGYSVIDLDPRHGWAHVESSDGRRGYVRLGGAVAGRSFEDWFPEIHFIEGASGFLRYRQVDGPWPRLHDAAERAAIRALDAYVRLDTVPGESIPRAVARQMMAAMSLEGAGGRPVIEAIQLLQAAAESAPYSAEALQLAVFAKLKMDVDRDRVPPRPTEMEASLHRAARLAPDNPTVLRNLRNYYTLASGAAADSIPGWKSIDRETAERYRDRATTLDRVLVNRPAPADHLVDLNSATLKQVRALPGIDGKMATLIVQRRPFSDLHDPALVTIIGKARVAALETRAFVSGAGEGSEIR